MEIVNRLITSTLPNYFSSLPIPKSVFGFIQLSGGDWIALIPFVGTVSLIAYVTVKAFQPKPPVKKEPICNLKIQKEVQKVVNIVDIEEIGEKVSYCRCWRSKRFPLCDGSHNKHNEDTGDNVGPLVLKRKSN